MICKGKVEFHSAAVGKSPVSAYENKLCVIFTVRLVDVLFAYGCLKAYIGC